MLQVSQVHLIERNTHLRQLDHILIRSFEFINNMIISKKPGYLYSQIKMNQRACAQISFYSFPKSTALKSTMLYKGISYFNQLPKDIKLLPRDKFKARLKNERHLLKQLAD